MGWRIRSICRLLPYRLVMMVGTLSNFIYTVENARRWMSLSHHVARVSAQHDVCYVHLLLQRDPQQEENKVQALKLIGQ
jgi:hypothetical protein